MASSQKFMHLGNIFYICQTRSQSQPDHPLISWQLMSSSDRKIYIKILIQLYKVKTVKYWYIFVNHNA